MSRSLRDKPATIHDVARLAGVSKSTVSNVVRGAEGHSSSTRARVRDAIDALAYRPNLLARQMVQQRTHVIGVIIGDLANPFYSEMAKAVELEASARGYHVMLCSIHIDERRALASLRSLLDYRVAGLVILAYAGNREFSKAVTGARIPSVFVTCRGDFGDIVSTDDEKGGQLAAQHLIGLGHKRIAYVGDPSVEDAADAARADGYRAAMREAGLTPIARHWKGLSLQQLLTGRERPTGVVCSNDLGAIEILDTADRLGIRVPEDLSVVGYDDITLAGLKRISLTTITQPKGELARVALSVLYDRIVGGMQSAPNHIIVDCGLVVRRSSAPPRG
jgi:LacI family transcriptional regulator